MAKKNDFLGRGWSFPPEFNNDFNEVSMVSDEIDIQQSLRILLNTSLGERIMLPDYGCSLREFLFQSIDTSTISYMKHLISNSILKYESRIDLNDLDIDTSDAMDGVVLINISYTIRTTNNRNNIVFPFYLNEGTLLDS
ncbi:MAG: GPW/gp25 family protein [Sphingobacteriaceae bacterium]|jgi:phage baseplate assembly protein W